MNQHHHPAENMVQLLQVSMADKKTAR